jgi:predicted nucleotidyltransferase
MSAERDPTIDPERDAFYEGQLRELILDKTSGLSCEVFLFGSRAKGKARRASDFDIGIRGLSEKSFESVRRSITDSVEEGNIPHDVDIVDFDRATEPFRSVALKGRIIWKNA